MKNEFFKPGGKFFLAFTIAGIVACVFAVGALAYTQMLEQRKTMAVEGHSYISSQVSAAMSLWLGDQVLLAETLANAPELVTYCQSPLDSEKRAAAQTYLERKHRILPHFTLLSVMYYLQEGEDVISLTLDGKERVIRNGYSLVDSIGGKSVGVGGFTFSYIKAVYEGSVGFVSEAKPNAIPSLPPIFVVAVPVKDATGQTLGALVFGVKLNHFNRLFISNFHLGETGRIEIIDDQGLFVGTPESHKVLTERFRPEGQTLLPHLDSHKTSSFSVDLPDGTFDYSAAPVWTLHDMGGTWWVLFRRSSSELHQELTSARNWLILVCGLASLFMAVMAFRSNRAALGEAQERAMRMESELKKVFVDAAPYAVVLVEADWRIADVNPAAERLFAYAEPELLEKNIDELIVPHASMFSDFARNEPSGECTGRNKNGKLLVFAYDVCKLDKERHLVFFRDETELAAQRKRAAELSENLAGSLRESERLRIEAERANNAKSEFLANMSHEIRTPMNAVIGMTHLLLQQKLDSKLRAYGEKIQDAGKTLLGVINSVLDFSKIEAGKMELETLPFDLSNVLERLSSIFQQPFVEKKLALSIACAPDVPRALMGDPLRLEQVITNLLSNALKFTDTGGVNVAVRLLEKIGNSVRLEFSITDTGIGMSMEDCKRLFKAFSQADTSTTRKYGGTGLGLVIAKLLVELMQGDIYLQSEPGKGTTFSFTALFGIAAENARHEETAAAGHVPDLETLSGKRVLLVEDNPINQDVASELLLGVGIIVAIAENGKVAVEMLSSPGHGFDLVLMDVQMPIMDGHEAARRIRRLPHNAALPILAMTAHAMTSERERCIASGMNDHLSKPIEVDRLYASLERWFAKTAAQ